MTKNVLTANLSEPLNEASTANISIDVGDGNLTIDRLTDREPILANGTLEYLEDQDPPTHTRVSKDGQATFTLKGSHTGQRWLHLPWAACNGATHWQIHLNPVVSSDLTVHSHGGNVRLDLAGLSVTRLSAETGGGNMDVVLPGRIAGMSVAVKSGAGNVTVLMPEDMAARIFARTGLGKVVVDSRFGKLDENTYQSPDYDQAVKRVEITASSGAGNVNVLVQ